MNAALAGMNLVQTEAKLNDKQESASDEESLASMFNDQKVTDNKEHGLFMT